MRTQNSELDNKLASTVQGFAESLQQECSKPAQNVMIELYCCGPGLLFWLLLFQIRKGLGSCVFKVLLQRFCKTQYICWKTNSNRRHSTTREAALCYCILIIIKTLLLHKRHGSFFAGSVQRRIPMAPTEKTFYKVHFTICLTRDLGTVSR